MRQKSLKNGGDCNLFSADVNSKRFLYFGFACFDWMDNTRCLLGTIIFVCIIW